MRRTGFLVVFAVSALAACSGGGSIDSLPPAIRNLLPSSAPAFEPNDAAAIETANGIGAPLADYAAYEASLPVASGANGGCDGNVSFTAPDAKGEANSTETRFYYDQGCGLIAQDVVRNVVRTSQATETVAQTVSIDIPSPIVVASAPPTATQRVYATRSTLETVTSPTFDANGYPNFVGGFERTSKTSITFAGQEGFGAAGTTYISGDDGLVLLPATLDQNGDPTNVNLFCDQTAGYDTVVFPALREAFGWSGGIFVAGTRTANGDGTVTYSGTHEGAGAKGDPSGFSFTDAASKLLPCPSTTQPLLLNGGSNGGPYALPLQATFANGALTGFTLSHPSLPNGYTVSFQKIQTKLNPAGYAFEGTLSKDGSRLGLIEFDAYGQGALQIDAGRQYTMTDFHIYR